MGVKAEVHLTRAQAEGMSYRLPDDEQNKTFKELVRSVDHEPGALLEVLHVAQECFGYLSKNILGWIAQELRIPRREVYEAATFYSLFSLKGEAKYAIRVCDCLSCYLNGGEKIFSAIRDAANIPSNETTSQDNLFSLQTVSCLGLCDQSPAMMVNRARYGFLTPEKALNIICELRNKEHMEVHDHD
jgi:NADH:ubiquinone oxidoreductase subunit E